MLFYTVLFDSLICFISRKSED